MTKDNPLKDCISCGGCQEICPFLEAFGTPDKIIMETPENSFFCSNCKACSSVCPQSIDPSNAIFETKTKLIEEGRIPEKVSYALKSAKGFAARGRKFPFSYYSKLETVFWPGCGLAGTSPKIVKETMNLLGKHLNKKIGIVLDCCFDPVYQIGDINTVTEAIESISNILKNHKVEHIITGCLNCTKILAKCLTDIKVEHYLDVLPKNITDNALGSELYLHHPCPSFRFDGMRANANDFISSNNNKGIRQSTTPLCCGFGGGLASTSPDLSDKFTERILNEAGTDKIVTYCVGCKSRLLNKGKKAYHLLELITKVEPIEKPVSSLNKWINRFLLATRQRFNIKKLFVALLAVMLIFITSYLREQGYISMEGIFAFLERYKNAAPLLFIFIYAIGPTLFIPSLPLTLGAGFLWGPIWGVVFSITGATIGASVAFLISRYVLGATIKEKFGHDKWRRLLKKVETHGWKAVAFSRIMPIFPYPVLNYLFGITPIPFLHYLWSTFVFMLPACIAYVAFGSSLGELILKGNIEGVIIGILIAAVAMLLPLVLKRMLKKVS